MSGNSNERVSGIEKKRKNNKRQEILEAALQVVEADGANHLTINAVAEKSGFSKGGVLYHFASKNALLSSMIEYLIDANQSRMDEALIKGPGVLSALIDAESRMSEKERRASLAMLAAAAENAELVLPAKVYMKKVFNAIYKESDGDEEATLLFLANEGLRYLEVLGLTPLKSRELRRIRAHMRAKAAGLKS